MDGSEGAAGDGSCNCWSGLPGRRVGGWEGIIGSNAGEPELHAVEKGVLESRWDAFGGVEEQGDLAKKAVTV